MRCKLFQGNDVVDITRFGYSPPELSDITDTMMASRLEAYSDVLLEGGEATLLTPTGKFRTVTISIMVPMDPGPDDGCYVQFEAFDGGEIEKLATELGLL